MKRTPRQSPLARTTVVGISLLLGAALTPLEAQTPPPVPPPPRPCAGDAYRTFDFWLGTWEVVNPAGAVVGRNQSTAGNGGCTVTDRITWTRQEDGRVRQFWEQSLDGGTSWQTAFDGMYRPVAPGGG